MKKVTSLSQLDPDKGYWDSKDQQEIVFSRIGGTGMAIFHPPNEPDTQSSWAVDEKYVIDNISEMQYRSTLLKFLD